MGGCGLCDRVAHTNVLRTQPSKHSTRPAPTHERAPPMNRAESCANNNGKIKATAPGHICAPNTHTHAHLFNGMLANCLSEPLFESKHRHRHTQTHTSVNRIQPGARARAHISSSRVRAHGFVPNAHLYYSIAVDSLSPSLSLSISLSVSLPLIHSSRAVESYASNAPS